MALTVEDGSIVTGADTYVTSADFVAYAATLGITIADDAATEVLLRKAFEYINSLEPRLLGIRTLKTQPNAYPRDNLFIEDYAWDDDEIPRQVIMAQQLLALDLNDGVDIYNRPQSSMQPVRKQKVSVIEREFAVSDSPRITSQTRAVRVLASLMKNNGLSLAISMA